MSPKEIPEEIEEIFNHFKSCAYPNPKDSTRERCIMCSNIIASAIISFLETRHSPTIGSSVRNRSILLSRTLKTISSMYNHCKRALPFTKLSILSSYLQKQSEENLLPILENHLYSSNQYKPTSLYNNTMIETTYSEDVRFDYSIIGYDSISKEKREIPNSPFNKDDPFLFKTIIDCLYDSIDRGDYIKIRVLRDQKHRCNKDVLINQVKHLLDFYKKM